jgi:hypothetical protein
LGFPFALWVAWQVFWIWWWFFGWVLGASDFLYGDLIELWRKWRHVMPWWYFIIPTWRDWWTYPLLGLLAFAMYRRPNLKQYFLWFLPVKEAHKRPNYDDDFNTFGQGANAGRRRGNPDNDFDPSAFGKGKGKSQRRALDPSRLIERFKPRDETEARAYRKAQDPATSDAERQSIYQIMDKRRNKKGRNQ